MHAFCHRCGSAFPDTSRFPRTCAACGLQVWSNPIPVAVALVPVLAEGRVGLLVVRRAIAPREGLLAPPGGFVEDHETWQQGAVREVWEETQIRIPADAIVGRSFVSTAPRPNRILMFCEAPPLAADALAPFVPTAESSERGVVFGPDGLAELFAFPLHADAAVAWFGERGIAGAARFEAR